MTPIGSQAEYTGDNILCFFCLTSFSRAVYCPSRFGGPWFGPLASPRVERAARSHGAYPGSSENKRGSLPGAGQPSSSAAPPSDFEASESPREISRGEGFRLFERFDPGGGFFRIERRAGKGVAPQVLTWG